MILQLNVFQKANDHQPCPQSDLSRNHTHSRQIIVQVIMKTEDLGLDPSCNLTGRSLIHLQANPEAYLVCSLVREKPASLHVSAVMPLD